MIHKLKTWPEYYNRVVTKQKKFEIRYNDRDFQTGDTLILQEWDSAAGQYTSREVRCNVDYVFTGRNMGLQDGYAVLGITVTS